jgi:hypothetical protein
MTQNIRSSRNMLLTLSACILLALPSAVGQTRSDTSAIGTWLGAIDIGGARLRVVFHIATSQGVLTGTVDSPDKGVKGIPLSRVYANGDSLLLEVSAALVSYEGIFSNERTTIKGIWKEQGTVFPLILSRSNDTIESKVTYDNAKDNTLSLDLQKTSIHFDYYSSDADRKVLDDIANVLEENFTRITNRLQTQFAERIRVYIYPDTRTFHAAIYVPDAPDWVVGAGGINELKMVSPLNPGSVHTYASLMQAIVHELVHAAVLNARGERGLAGLPKWLNEGFAFYEAHQMTDAMSQTVKSHATKEPLPTWTTLDTASVTEFGNMDGYVLSTMIIEFLVNTYGYEKLLKLIKAPESMNAIYGTSRDSLEKQWIRYVKNN